LPSSASQPGPQQQVAKVHRHECGGIRVEPALAAVRQAVTTRVHVGVGQRVRGAAVVVLGEIRTEGKIPALYTRATLEPPIRLALSQAGYAIKRCGISPGRYRRLARCQTLTPWMSVSSGRSGSGNGP
jgi:hypothetical protein